jgi:hypothetical protein
LLKHAIRPTFSIFQKSHLAEFPPFGVPPGEFPVHDGRQPAGSYFAGDDEIAGMKVAVGEIHARARVGKETAPGIFELRPASKGQKLDVIVEVLEAEEGARGGRTHWMEVSIEERAP